MRPIRAILLVTSVGGLLLASGCYTHEDACQRLCDWESHCVQGSVGVADCTQDCVRDADKHSNDCDNSFDDFINCIQDNQASCPGVDKQCQREAARLIQKCDCTNPTGPLKELCATD